MNCRIIVVGLLVSFALLGQGTAAPERPNVILIMVDDLGYGDLSCYGNEKMKTPVLDKLAADGIRLTSFYAGATVCTPSRMALMTGAYPPRVGWYGGVMGYGMKTVNGLAPEALTIAEVFKGEGYQTGMCGKWHIGRTPEMHPTKQGFDTTYFIHMSNNQTKKLYRGESLEEDPFDNKFLTEKFTREAIKFIEGNKNKSFFLYLPFTAPHFPAQAHPDWKGKSDNAAYGDVVEELDSRIGEILKALESAKLDQRTIVVFISDNGPDPSQRKWASAGPYSGLKWDAREGGTRVACIFRWPGVVPAGQKTDELTTAIDILPTLAHACGIDLEKISKGSPRIDGVNVWDTIVGKKTKHPRTDLLYWHGWGVLHAIRVGDWKLYLDKVKGVPGSEKGPALFNLAEDPGENKNLSDQHAQRVKEMKELAVKQLEDIEANAMPLGGRPDGKKREPKRGMWIK
jgi:arylsulfatase A-like enzyme